MMRRACAMVAVALIGCGDDGGGSGVNDAGSDASNGTDSGGGSGTALFTGTGCEGAVDYTLRGDEKVTLYTGPTTGSIEYMFVKDGPFFDFESEPAWATYAASHDTFLMFVFQNPQPFTVHTTNDAVYSSLFGGRDTGTINLAGGTVSITAIDTTAKTISVTFTVVVTKSTPAYPPVFAASVECFDTTPGSITGGFSGTYDVMQF